MGWLKRHRLVVGVAIAGLALSACASGEPAKSSSPDPKPSVTPTEQPIDVSLSVPKGRYKVRMVRTAHRPAGEQISAPRQSFVWRFRLTECSYAECHGVVRSSGGATYGYTWDGTKVGLTRSKMRGRSQSCVDGTFGSFAFSWRYFSRGLKPMAAVADSRPVKLRGVLTQRASYSKWAGCVRTSGYPTLVRYTLLARKLG